MASDCDMIMWHWHYLICTAHALTVSSDEKEAERFTRQQLPSTALLFDLQVLDFCTFIFPVINRSWTGSWTVCWDIISMWHWWNPAGRKGENTKVNQMNRWASTWFAKICFLFRNVFCLTWIQMVAFALHVSLATSSSHVAAFITLFVKSPGVLITFWIKSGAGKEANKWIFSLPSHLITVEATTIDSTRKMDYGRGPQKWSQNVYIYIYIFECSAAAGLVATTSLSRSNINITNNK